MLVAITFAVLLALSASRFPSWVLPGFAVGSWPAVSSLLR